MRRIAHLAARRTRTAFAGLLAAIALLVASAPAEAAPRVVATIAPVHSLVAGIMEGIGEPYLLLPGEASPHDFALRPSDARAIAEADLVVWVGESLETFLTGVLATSGAPALELIDARGVEPRPYRTEEEDAGHDDHAEKHAHDDGHDHASLDPHVWLDPVRARAIVAAVSERLAAIDPGNDARYRANSARLSDRLAELDGRLEAQLAPVRGKSFVTFHEGFGYFVERYGLAQALGLTLDPQRRPGARTIAALRQRATEEGIVCAFAEPQFDERMVSRLAEETGMRLGWLDPLGAGRAPGPDLYFEVLEANAASIAECLASGRVADEPRN
ncbi:MAG TPA: zinc ABC transporter substrate-binding protein [Afifellaceae bacterium]|nr:zinc ABC transporter substrate-binding protein [Afifellaceae bacterium]